MGAIPLTLLPDTSSGAGKITQDGQNPVEVTLDVHVAWSPTQSDLDELEEKLTKASRLICDATEGGVLIKTYDVRNSGQSANEADMYIYPSGTFPRSMVTGWDPFYTKGDQRILHTHFGSSPGTWGHEFGHLIMGLKDQYENQTFDGGCGIAHSIDDDDLQYASTIMQSYTPYCATAYYGGSFSEVSCTLDSDCVANAPPGYDKCSVAAPQNSEFTAGPFFEQTLGDDGIDYPGPRAGERLYLDVLLNDGIDNTEWREGNRTITYYHLDAQQDVTRHDIRIDMLGSVTPNRAFMRAMTEDTNGDEVSLMWQVDNVGSSTPMLDFESSGTCAGESGQYGLDQIEGLSYAGLDTPTVELDIPAAVLGAGESALIEVDLSDLCWNTNPNSYYVDVIRAGFEPDGKVNGAVFGSTAAAYLADGPVYQQLDYCEPDPNGGHPTYEEIEMRWKDSTQRWENSNQWVKVYRTLSPADTCEAVDAGEIGCACLPGNQCNDEGATCFWGSVCVNPDCNPEEPFCGLHLLTTGDDWEFLRYNLEYEYRREARFPAIDMSSFDPVYGPEEDPTVHGCDTLAVDINDDDIDPVENVSIVIDYSKSMDESWHVTGETDTKIAWARKAVKGFLDDSEDDGIAVSVIGISLFPKIFVGLSDLVPTPGPGQVSAEDIVDILDDFEPTSASSVGDAVYWGVDELAGHSNKAIFLITDGETTTGVHTVEEACSYAANNDVPIYVSPIGDSFDHDKYECVAAAGGKLVNLVDSDEIPSGLMDMETEYEGQQLSLAYARSEVAQSLTGVPTSVAYDIPVESGGDALRVLITPQVQARDTWELEFVLYGPGGESITQDDAAFVTVDADNFYYDVRVPSPSVGTWTLKLIPPDYPTPKPIPEAQVVTARVEHEGGPRCRVSTSETVIDSANATLEIFAQATWDGVIHEGASYTATVLAPDGTETSVPMKVGEDGRGVGAMSNFTRDGLHRVQVSCDVPATATYAYGEDDQGAGTTTTTVPGAFTRVHTEGFIVDAGLIPTPGGPEPCDEDGWPDSLEGTADLDGDGWPNYCDEDSDGDDLPDHLESFFDTDGDGTVDIHDRDSDDDGELDGSDWAPFDFLSYKRHASGDINGDGAIDHVRGEPDHNNEAGRIMIDYGAQGQTPDEEWHRNTYGVNGAAIAGDRFGEAVVVADFDGDGFDDVAVGVPGDSHFGASNAGAINVLYGSASGLTYVGDQHLSENSSGMQGTAEDDDGFGASLSSGDFNCDGYADLVIGIPTEDINTASDAGAVSVIYGTAGGLGTVNDIWYQGANGVNGGSETGDHFGETLATGDFDGDDCSDLVIGAPEENWGATVDAGNAYVNYGSGAGLSTVGDWTIIQGVLAGVVEAYDFFATRLWVRDEDGDGFDDLVVMTPGDCTGVEKGFNTVYGSSSGLGTTNNTLECKELHND